MNHRPFSITTITAGAIMVFVLVATPATEAVCVPLQAAQPAVEQSPKAVSHPLVIRLAPKARWDASLRDVEKVLRSAAAELWAHFPERKLEPILVEPKGGPIVLFRRGPQQEYQVRLNTGGTYWAQYAFQFAHEFCHILCNYREGEACNKWFEESLCEVASLFALRRMSETWKTNPPYPNWKDYARHLSGYAGKRIEQCPLPGDVTLAKWYETHADQLRKDPCQRDKNRIVAAALLPMFEEHPEHWASLGYLNSGEPVEGRSFQDYLAAWHERAPAKHRPFILQIARKFGIAIPAGKGSE